MTTTEYNTRLKACLESRCSEDHVFLVEASEADAFVRTLMEEGTKAHDVLTVILNDMFYIEEGTPRFKVLRHTNHHDKVVEVASTCKTISEWIIACLDHYQTYLPERYEGEEDPDYTELRITTGLFADEGMRLDICATCRMPDGEYRYVSDSYSAGVPRGSVLTPYPDTVDALLDYLS